MCSREDPEGRVNPPHSPLDITPVWRKFPLRTPSSGPSIPSFLSFYPLSRPPRLSSWRKHLGFSPENTVPPSLVPIRSREGKSRSAWRAVQLSFEANRWWRVNDNSLTASFEVIGDNLYLESELDHCQKGRRLIWKWFHMSPCFLHCPSPLLSFLPSHPCFFNPCSRQLVSPSLGPVCLVLGHGCYESQQQLIKASDNLCYWCIVAFQRSN